MTKDINRRDFLKRAAGTVGTAATVYGLSGSRPVLGANDKVVVGVIGTGRMGMDNLEDFAKQPEVEIAAVCDVYQPNLDQAAKATNGAAKTYKDFREILDRKEIDAVVVAAPDHWHALPMVLACQAGKDVYVEKPISTALDEGKQMVAAARKYNRVVQVGTQQRSGIHFQKAVELVQDGMIGKVTFARTWNYSNDCPQGIGNP
jgi:predicted dehydrogenase